MTTVEDAGARPAGTEGDLVVPGSAEWLATASASKVAAILGISPWESAFSTWWRMAGTLGPDEPTVDMRRGHWLEPAIAAWFADQHPDWEITTTGTWSHPERPWQTASPDRLVHTYDADPVALLECKSDAEHEAEWGEPGTDEIPPWYRAQCLWQLDTVGVDRCHVAVLFGRGLRFAEYVVDYDAAECAEMRATVEAFLGTVERGELPPIDSSDRTYQVLRRLAPGIEDTTVDLDDDLAREFIGSKALAEAAAAEHQLAKSLVAVAMGEARRAVWQGQTIASRQCRGSSLPFVVAARNLPALTITEGTP